MNPLVARWSASMAEVPRQAWDALAAPQDNPFLEWDWLDLMEQSGSVGPDEGWTPHHLTLWDAEALVAAAPFYLKDHSEGEFVFDHPWAELARRLRLHYYPKLLGMSPFTPTANYRFLLAPGLAPDVSAHLLQLLQGEVAAQGLSGSHLHYVDPALADSAEALGYSRWIHPSFLWENRGYRDFDDFLATFRRGQRRNIIKERRALQREGVDVVLHPGPEITPRLMQLMYGNYVQTNAKFGIWGCKYLSRQFFEQLPGRFGRHLLLAVAYRNGGVLATALFVHKAGRLYGRYWGGEDVRYLHFEVCYYAPIQWAITQGLDSFDPGIGGYHKVRRGFTAVPNISLHKFADPRLRAIMQTHIDSINAQQWAEIEAINAQRPLEDDETSALPANDAGLLTK